MSDADVFGAPSMSSQPQAPAVTPAAPPAAQAPTPPVDFTDPSLVDGQYVDKATGNPFTVQTTNGVRTVNGQPTGAAPMSDAAVFGQAAGGPPPEPTKSDEGLGFQSELMRPLDNAALWTEQGLTKLGLPVVNWEHGLGMPSAADTMAAHHKVLSDAAAGGVAPGKIGGVFGGILGTAPAMMIPGGPLAQGAAMGALSTDKPNDLGAVATSAGVGGVLGKFSDILGKGIVDTVAPKISDAAQLLLNKGVPLTTGMIAGGKGVLGRLEQVAHNVPVAGELIRKRGNEALVGFNHAAANDAVAPLGVSVPRGNTGHELYQNTKGVVTKAYSDVGNGVNVPLDGQYAADMQTIGARPLPADLAARFAHVVNREVAGRVDPSVGGFTSDGITDAKAALNKEVARVKNPTLFDSDYVDNLKDTRNALTSMLGRTSPEAKAQLAAADSAYPGFKTYQRAVNNSTNNSTSPNGYFTPQQLQSAVNAGATADSRASATGGPLQALAEAGKDILPAGFKKVISPMQSAIEAAVGAGVAGTEVLGTHHAGVALAAPSAVLSPLYSKPVQDLLRSGLVKTAAGRKAFEKVLGPIENYLTPAATTLGARAAAPALSAFNLQPTR